ncbi:ankyrin-3-like [Alosa pseudoharengus]|uniref:ankyrin-3-like n=1 Tax=Alosa pseudoharengus TaxID=34774 RepID=UPI003F8933B2
MLDFILLIKETVERTTTRTLPGGYAHKPVFSTRSYQAWSAAPITVPGQAKCGLGSLVSSSSTTPSASPLKSVWSISSSPIKSTLGASNASPTKSVCEVASPIRSYRTIASPIKTVVQQGQYPTPVSASLMSSPIKTATDPASVKALAATLSSRASPATHVGSMLDRSAISMTPPDSPKSSMNMYSSSLPFKSVLASMATASPPSVKTISSLSTIKPSADIASTSKGTIFTSALTSPAKSTVAASETMLNGSVSPIKYPSPSPAPSRILSGVTSSLQERIQATTQAATSSVTAAIDESFNSCGAASYSALKSMSPSLRASVASSVYSSLRSHTAATTTTTVSSSTITVPVYSLVNVLPDPQLPRATEITPTSRSAAAQQTHTPAQSSSPRSKTTLKSSLFLSPTSLKAATASSLSHSQDLLRDVADMKEDLMRMTAILQSDASAVAKTYQSQAAKEAKVEDEEPFSLVEKVKEDLVKVSEILTKDVLSEAKAAARERASEEDWEEFSKDEIEDARQNALRSLPTFEPTLPVRPQSVPDKDLNFAKVVDYLMNDIGASSLSKMADAKCRYEEMRKDGEEKQKRGIKPEHKLKMPPTGMRSSPSEKDLSKLADSYMGPETILESPDDFSHEQDKSPLSDSGFETRSDKTPSAPQSAESTGPKPLFTDVPPVITETRTEVVHIRSYEHPDDLCEPMMEEATSGAATAAAIAEASASACLEPEPAVASLKDKVKTFQIKVNTEEDYSKSMCLKEETHITTTTRMVYHKPQLTEGSGDRMEETMSVRDIMKAFQSGRDPSKELAGLFEHKAAQDSIKGDELSPRFLDKDSKGKPKVERIIEVHIEKGNTSDPTEVIIRETKKHPDYRSMKELLDKAEGDYEVMQEEDDFAAEESLPSYLDTSRVNTPVSQEEDSRPSSAQLIADDSYKTLKLLSQHSIEYHDDEQSELRGESYRFAEKMLHSEKLDTSHSDTEEVAADQARGQAAEAQGAEGYSGERVSGTRKETHFKSKDASDKSGKFTQKDEPYDKLTVLHYTTEPGSPKHAVWMRFTQDRQDRNREKLIYEDRLDRTVKEAEEKLSEVSQFFRDKTEKLNDELQSPEKKPTRRVPRETRSGPSSMCSSPEKTQQKREASSGEEWARGSMRESSVGKLFGSERKSASVPSSPERRSQLQTSEEKPKEDSGETPTKVPPPVAAKSSKVTAFKQKFEAEAQKQESSTPRSPKPPVKKFQESKLPVYQPVQGSKTSKSPSEEEKISPKKAEVDKSRTSKGPCPDVSQSGISVTAPKQSIEPPPNKNATHSTAQKQIHSDSVRAADIGKDEKRAFEMRRNKDQLPQSKMHESSERDSGVDIQSAASSEAKRLLTKTDTRTSPLKQQGPSDMSKKVASPDCMPSDSTESGDMHSKTLRKKADSQIPVRSSGPSDSDQFSKAKQDTTVKQPEKLPSQIPTLTKTRVQGRSELGGLKSQDSTTSKLTDASSVEGKERATIVTTREGFKGLKSLPVYVSVQSGKGDKDSGGQNGSHKNLITVKQKQATSPQPSPDDDTFEQVSFIDSSGKSPMTPETPSSEEVSYDLMSRTPESLFLMPARPSPIPEVSEESESDEQRKAFSFKESPPEKPKIITVAAEPSNANAGQVAKARRVAYIEFPPPPPLEDQSQPEPKGSSSDADTEMMEVNLQEEHDKHLLAEPIIRVQPPSPVPPGADESSSSDDESVFQPIHSKKYKFKVDEKKEEKETKPKKQDKNGNHKDNGLNGSGDDEYEQNGNDQSITDCSIATTAEFSHDTDATEIDSLDGYDLQDEDDGLSDQNAKPFSFGIDNRKDVWSTDSMLRPSDRAFSQTRLDVIEEEPLPIEEGKKEFDKTLEDGNENVVNEKQSKSEGHSETYFSYKLVEEFNTPFKTVATKGLDFDPWSSKGGDDEVVDARIKDDEPKPFGLAVDDKSQGTSPDTTPARTPTDESTPTSEPNPFPFHEGKMFEMTRSGAIDMSKRDFVEERLQFFQIGEHTREARSREGGRARTVDTAMPEAREKDQFHASDATIASCSIIQITTDRRDTTSIDNTQDSSSDTITASRVQSKLCSTFKVGVPMTSVLTMVGDYANQRDFNSKSSDTGPSGLESSIGIKSYQSTELFEPEQRRPFQIEHCNNNNNLEASNTDPNLMQKDSIVFNLMSFSEPSQTQPGSPSENAFGRDHTVKLEGHKVQSEPIKNLPSGNIKESQPKSRLPVRAPLSSPCSQSTSAGNKQKPKQAVRPIIRPVVRERLDPFPDVKPKTRIPIKVKTVSTSSQREVKSGTAKATSSITKTTCAGVRDKDRGKKQQASSRLPIKDRSSRTSTLDPSPRSRSSSQTNRVGQSRPVSSTTAEVNRKATSRDRVKHGVRQSNEDTKMQADASVVGDDSTSRNTSLSDSSQSTHTSRSARDVRAEVEQADRERRRRRRRISGRTDDGGESSQVEGPQKVPSVENEPSL